MPPEITMRPGRLPHELPLMPLREVVMFPHAIMPLFVGREASIKAIEAGINEYGRKIFLVTQREAEMEKPDPRDLYSVGVTARILQVLRLPDGATKVLLEGLYRAAWEGVSADEPFGSGAYPRVCARPLHEPLNFSAESEALMRAVAESLEEYSKTSKKLTQENLQVIKAFRNPGQTADAVMPHIKLDYRNKQEILEIQDQTERLEKVYELLQNEMTVTGLEKNIKSRVKTQMERNQREYYLNEQMKAIHKEMGREDDPHAELAEIESRVKEKNMPEEARERALREVKKLRSMPPSSAEYTVVRNYVDWILDLPWNELKAVDIDIQKARAILDGDHYGLEKPKERILEFLAVQKLSDGLRGPILCFVGPPGVGKTSLAKSVARATGREYVRLSLGGVRDEAEIRGHRRTYVGALPGKIIQSLRRAKSNNPLFCLDEVDKMSADFRGDPAAALLEVLDPEQNCAFMDHYLDLDYDLSKVFFITTANTLHTIPPALKDRMEIIELSSYLETEKMRIGEKFLIPKQIAMHGLKPENLKISENALLDTIRYYTREAGVRNLEREIAALCRKVAVALVEENDENRCFRINRRKLGQLLGVKKYRYDEREKEPQIGVCTGLAYTQTGGDILMIETALMPGKGKVAATGQLGEVMKESAQAALSYVRSRAGSFGLKSEFHQEVDVHVHIPAGATPKDGPSAGITLTTSIVSALLGIPVRHDIAMTGEITLRGRVLPVGGLREKLLAARRGMISTVIMPRDNEKDLKEVPEEILNDLNIIFVDHVDEVLPLALATAGDELFSRRVDHEPLTKSLRRTDAVCPAAEAPAQ